MLAPYSLESKRQRINRQVSQYKNQRTTYEQHWRTIADYILPYRLRMNLSDYNKGDRRNLNIYDSTATQAVRTLKSGMMAYITSPASPWVRFTTEDPDMAEFGDVKNWLDWVAERIMTRFPQSTLYTSLPNFYGDMAGFGTSMLYVEPSAKTTIHARNYHPGSFWLGTDFRNTVNAAYWEFPMTVRQVYEEFWANGENGDNLSQHVRDMAQEGLWNERVDVGHIIYPNEAYDTGKLSAKHKAYASCWFELGSSGQTNGYPNGIDSDTFLRESGMDYFPALVGRWEVSEGEVYGIDCPGMLSIGDVKSLQKGEQRSYQAIDKLVNPHWIVPIELEGKPNDFLPGEKTYVSGAEGLKQIRAAHSPDLSIQELEGKQEQVRKRIKEAFYDDLFRMLEFLDDRDRTATEIAARKEEKLVQLSPMLEQLEVSVLRPLIDITFRTMLEQGEFEAYPPPPDIQGKELKVEFLGILSQARKQVQIGPMQQVATFAAQLAAVAPDAMDNLNTDEFVKHIADKYAIPAECMNSKAQVEAMRQARAQQAQAQAMAERIPAMAGAAKDLSQATLEGDNALTRVAGAVGNAAGAVPGR